MGWQDDEIVSTLDRPAGAPPSVAPPPAVAAGAPAPLKATWQDDEVVAPAPTSPKPATPVASGTEPALAAPQTPKAAPSSPPAVPALLERPKRFADGVDSWTGKPAPKPGKMSNGRWTIGGREGQGGTPLDAAKSYATPEEAVEAAPDDHPRLFQDKPGSRTGLEHVEDDEFEQLAKEKDEGTLWKRFHRANEIPAEAPSIIDRTLNRAVESAGNVVGIDSDRQKAAAQVEANARTTADRWAAKIEQEREARRLVNKGMTPARTIEEAARLKRAAEERTPERKAEKRYIESAIRERVRAWGLSDSQNVLAEPDRPDFASRALAVAVSGVAQVGAKGAYYAKNPLKIVDESPGLQDMSRKQYEGDKLWRQGDKAAAVAKYAEAGADAFRGTVEWLLAGGGVTKDELAQSAGFPGSEQAPALSGTHTPPAARNILDTGADIVGSLSSFLALMATAKVAFPTAPGASVKNFANLPAATARFDTLMNGIAWETTNNVTSLGGDYRQGEGLVMGLTLGLAAAAKAVNPSVLKTAGLTGAEAVGFAALTAEGGGTLDDALVNGLVPVVFQSLASFKGLRARLRAAKTPQEAQAVVKEIATWADEKIAAVPDMPDWAGKPLDDLAAQAWEAKRVALRGGRGAEVPADPVQPAPASPKVAEPAPVAAENPLQKASRENREGMAEVTQAVSEVAPGVKVSTASPSQGDISVSADGKEIRIQPNFLKLLKEMYPNNWRDALRTVIEEEVIHQRHVTERGGKEAADKSFADEWNNATEEERIAVRAAYGSGEGATYDFATGKSSKSTISDAQWGAELARMREQAGNGTLTESFHPKRGAAAGRAIEVLNRSKAPVSEAKTPVEAATPSATETQTGPSAIGGEKPPTVVQGASEPAKVPEVVAGAEVAPEAKPAQAARAAEAAAEADRIKAEAEAAGIRYDGPQFNADEKTVRYYQVSDPETKATFAIKPGDNVAEKLAAKRKEFAEAPAKLKAKQEVASAKEAKGKVAWEMTAAELVRADISGEVHMRSVEQAIAEGKPVPRETIEPYAGEPWADAALAKGKVEPVPTEAAKAKPRIVSQEAYDAAIKQLISMRPKANPVFDLATLKSMTVIGSYHLENIVRTTGRISKIVWSRAMRAELPAELSAYKTTKYLRKIWAGLTADTERWTQIRKLAVEMGKGPKGREVGNVVKAATGQAPERVTMTARQTLAAVIKATNRGATTAIAETESSGKVLRETLVGIVKDRLPPELQQAQIERIAKAKNFSQYERLAEDIDVRAERWETKQAIQATLGQANLTQGMLAALARRYLAPADRGKITPALVKAKTPEQLQKVRRMIQKIADATDWREARRELVKAMPTSVELRKMSPVERDGVRAILNAIDFRDLTVEARQKALDLQDAMRTDPKVPISHQDQALLSRLTKTPLSDLTSGDVKQMTRLIKEAVTTSRAKIKAHADEWAAAHVKDRDAAVDEINASTSRKVAYDESGKPTGNRAVAEVRSLGPAILKPDDRAGRLGKTAARVLQSDLKAGENKYLKVVYDAYDALKAKAETLGLTVENLQAMQDQQTAKVVSLASGQEVSLTAANRIQLDLMARDPDLLYKVLRNGLKKGGNPRNPRLEISTDDIEAVRAMLTPEQRAIADHIYEWNNRDGRRLMNEWSMDEYGYEIAQRENHTPGHADRSDVPREIISDAPMLHDAVLEHLGITQARKQHGLPMLLGDAFNEFVSHVNNVARLNGMAKPIRKGLMLLGDPKVKTALADRYGPHEAQFWDEHVRIGGRGFEPPAGAVARTVQALNNQVAKGILALRATSKLKQLGSIPVAATEIPEKYLAEGMADIYSPKIDAEMNRESMQTRLRYDNSGVHLVLPVYGERPKLFGGNRWQKVLDAQMNLPGVGLQKGDRQVLRVLWSAARRMVLDTKPNLKDGSKEFFDSVREIHERAISKTQNTTSMLDMNGIELEARNNPLLRTFIMFQNQSNQMLNVLVRAGRDFRAERTPENAKKVLRAVGYVGLNAAWSIGVGAVAREVYRGFRPMSQSEEEKRKWNWAWNIANEAGGMVYGGRAATRLIQEFTTRGTRGATFDPDTLEGKIIQVAGGVYDLATASSEEGYIESGPDKGMSKSSRKFQQGAENLSLGLLTFAGVGAEFPYKVVKGIVKGTTGAPREFTSEDVVEDNARELTAQGREADAKAMLDEWNAKWKPATIRPLTIDAVLRPKVDEDNPARSAILSDAAQLLADEEDADAEKLLSEYNAKLSPDAAPLMIEQVRAKAATLSSTDDQIIQERAAYTLTDPKATTDQVQRAKKTLRAYGKKFKDIAVLLDQRKARLREKANDKKRPERHRTSLAEERMDE